MSPGSRELLEHVHALLHEVRAENQHYFGDLKRRMIKIMASLDRLESSVAQLDNVADGVLAVLAQVVQQIRDNAGNETRMTKLADNIDARAAALAAAITVNTPADPGSDPNAGGGTTDPNAGSGGSDTGSGTDPNAGA